MRVGYRPLGVISFIETQSFFYYLPPVLHEIFDRSAMGRSGGVVAPAELDPRNTHPPPPSSTTPATIAKRIFFRRVLPTLPFQSSWPVSRLFYRFLPTKLDSNLLPRQLPSPKSASPRSFAQELIRFYGPPMKGQTFFRFFFPPFPFPVVSLCTPPTFFSMPHFYFPRNYALPALAFGNLLRFAYPLGGHEVFVSPLFSHRKNFFYG